MLKNLSIIRIARIKKKTLSIIYTFNLCLAFLLWSCESKKISTPLFKVLDNSKTGLDFNNKLSYNKDFNLFKYMYFYNGSGTGAGDFNNDGLIDLFFASNLGKNKLYLNQAELKFKD